MFYKLKKFLNANNPDAKYKFIFIRFTINNAFEKLRNILWN